MACHLIVGIVLVFVSWESAALRPGQDPLDVEEGLELRGREDHLLVSQARELVDSAQATEVEEDAMPDKAPYCELNGGSSLHKSPWQEYAAFHREGRKALAKGESRPLLVWRCDSLASCGGNADQIDGLIRTFYLAVETKRLFFIEWSRYKYDISTLLQSRHIDWHLPKLLNCFGNWSESFMAERQSFKGDLWNQDSCVNLSTNAEPRHQHALAAGLGRYRPGCAFRYLFKASPVLKMAAAKRHPGSVVNGPYLAVHVGVGVGSGSQDRIGVDQTIVLDHALKCARFLYSEPLPIVVYTGNFDVKKLATDTDWLKSSVGNVSVSTTRGEDGELFFPANTGDRRPANQTGGPQMGLVNAWADQWGLANAVGVVKSQSGFARWATEMGLLNATSVKRIHVEGGKVLCQDSTSPEFW